MSNHYHLVIETPLPNLSKGMAHLNGTYTQNFNRKNKKVEHVFQGMARAYLERRYSMREIGPDFQHRNNSSEPCGPDANSMRLSCPFSNYLKKNSSFLACPGSQELILNHLKYM